MTAWNTTLQCKASGCNTTTCIKDISKCLVRWRFFQNKLCPVTVILTLDQCHWTWQSPDLVEDGIRKRWGLWWLWLLARVFHICTCSRHRQKKKNRKEKHINKMSSWIRPCQPHTSNVLAPVYSDKNNIWMRWCQTLANRQREQYETDATTDGE